MTYIPNRVLYDDFTNDGIYGITARQALEAAIDELLPAYHLILCPVKLYQYTKGAEDPLTTSYKRWSGLTVRVPTGVLYTLNFYQEHPFVTHEGKPTAVVIPGPLGTPDARPDVPVHDVYLLWPEGESVVIFDRSRLFFLREDLEALANGTKQTQAVGNNAGVAGQQVVEVAKPSQLLLIAALLELLKQPRQGAMNQEGVKSSLLEQFKWRGLSKRNIESIFAEANRTAGEARKETI